MSFNMRLVLGLAALLIAGVASCGEPSTTTEDERPDEQRINEAAVGWCDLHARCFGEFEEAYGSVEACEEECRERIGGYSDACATADVAYKECATGRTCGEFGILGETAEVCQQEEMEAGKCL